ncbi:membrane protein [Kosakonia radicincitans UMEnt01/12]|uniref:hypothetical protein n=1 Tax=Kosakonia radicincitans TaxID=283686 RepID=UPI0004610FCA|nr:hypothetical protein [Kosakonia radicincitans]KDE34193.1 membrane protein [Kosakonia radicincitans UMEnt01/12]
MHLSFLSGRAGGRIVLLLIALVLFTGGMFILASFFFDHDPDGHLLRDWLHDSRWAWFAWRICVYASITFFWFFRVRPALLSRTPDARQRLPRTELLVASFILFMEFVAWKGVV